MNIVRKCILSVLLIAFAFVSLSCSKKPAEAGWKAEIETVNGVKTIRNPETPRYGNFTFNLVEDLSLGQEKEEAYFFPRGAHASVDHKGTIYVSDRGNKRIQVFDQGGKFLRTLGRSGQGPGEYGYPGEVLFDKADFPYVRDSRRLVVFDQAGNFLKNIPMKTFLSRMILGPGGMIVGVTQPNPRAEGGPKNELIKLGPEGERSRTLAQYPVFGVSQDQLLMHWYTGSLEFCSRSDDSLYYGFSLDSTIHVIDGEGRPLLAFSKKEELVPISIEERDLTRKEGLIAWFGSGDPEKADLGMPDHRPFFFRFFNDDIGRLYVVRFKPITNKDPGDLVDVYSKDGFYLYQMAWRFSPQAVIKSGYIYDVREDDELGLYKVIRYKIANWADFRTE